MHVSPRVQSVYNRVPSVHPPLLSVGQSLPLLSIILAACLSVLCPVRTRHQRQSPRGTGLRILEIRWTALAPAHSIDRASCMDPWVGFRAATLWGGCPGGELIPASTPPPAHFYMQRQVSQCTSGGASSPLALEKFWLCPCRGFALLRRRPRPADLLHSGGRASERANKHQSIDIPPSPPKQAGKSHVQDNSSSFRAPE